MVGGDGRLHTTYGQETSTGRLTSASPNLQNIPVKGGLGIEIRKAFVASKGRSLIAADYSQIELRIVACLAQDRAMLEAFEQDRDVHAATAAEIFGVGIDQVTKDQRRFAKTINFGVLYGMSPYGLSQALGINRQEASRFIKRYFEVHAGIRHYCNQIIDHARRQGYVETLFGFRRVMEDINSSNHSLAEAQERMAVNAPVQGSAAEILKLAMIQLDKAFTKFPVLHKPQMILTVHDELVVEVDEKDAEAASGVMKSIMESVADLCVPLKVEIGIGANWAETK
ncbi:MAG: DNA polymerase I, thermostable [bacterium ADurb.Bin400]|nr:MAG: DNA polymerase I, thermostable [bacterium ADurb.Bin400]